MANLDSLIRYFREDILFNPIIWGICAVILWILGSALIKTWRGEDEE